MNALAELLARLHLRGFFWGDCSLSNALFRRDAGALSAYLVDAETGELHGRSRTASAVTTWRSPASNFIGELLDVDAEVGLPPDLDPDETATRSCPLRRLWRELTRDELFARTSATSSTSGCTG